MSKKKKWRCFFCNEVFLDPKEAYKHFGGDDIDGCDPDGPMCVSPLRTDEKARLERLKDAENYAMHCQSEANRTEELLEGLQAEHDNFFRYFGSDCNNMWQAADRYKNALYELDLLKNKKENNNGYISSSTGRSS